MEPDKILDNLSKEIIAALKAMGKTKDVNAKEAYSRIVKNLCESMGEFFELVGGMMPYDLDDDILDDDIPF